MNALATLAQGKYLLLTNDDMIFNTNGWYRPLREFLNQGSIGIACGRVINDGRFADHFPNINDSQFHIQQFSSAYRETPSCEEEIQWTESCQPWLIRKSDIPSWIATDPIKNQHKFLCEWIDPTGAGWACDWDLYRRVVLCGQKVAVVPQSVVYHYDHATLRERDHQQRGWGDYVMSRYEVKWGTSEKT